jgi:excisionase family DNA binding protein
MSTAHNGSQTVVSPLGSAGVGVQPFHSVSALRKPFGPPVVHGTPGPRAPLRALEGGAGRLLTVREAAERLAVSTFTVYGLCDRGELSHVRISNAIRIAPAALAAYLAGQRSGEL